MCVDARDVARAAVPALTCRHQVAAAAAVVARRAVDGAGHLQLRVKLAERRLGGVRATWRRRRRRRHGTSVSRSDRRHRTHATQRALLRLRGLEGSSGSAHVTARRAHARELSSRVGGAARSAPTSRAYTHIYIYLYEQALDKRRDAKRAHSEALLARRGVTYGVANATVYIYIYVCVMYGVVYIYIYIRVCHLRRRQRDGASSITTQHPHSSTPYTQTHSSHIPLHTLSTSQKG